MEYANESATALGTIDTKKPVVKDFVDRAAEAESFLKARLPARPGTTHKIHTVYESYDKKTARYRVNYFRSVKSETCIVPVNTIELSLYVEVRDTPDGFVYTDMTRLA